MTPRRPLFSPGAPAQWTIAELRLLRLIRRAAEVVGPEVFSSFLGLHALPHDSEKALLKNKADAN
jgi:hypothetical protein